MTEHVKTGIWAGHRIRTARKPGQCDYSLGRKGRCPNRIEKGDRYFDGELNPYKAGGFATDRYCMEHVNDH